MLISAVSGGSVGAMFYLDNYRALRVADNGIGLPSDFAWGDGRSLGLKVVHILIGQLQAHIAIEGAIDGERGTAFTFSWELQAGQPMQSAAAS